MLGGSAIRRVAPDVAFCGLLTGSTMLLRETSLMPPVPGLPALLSMLFAPVMELRCVRPSALSIAFVKQETSGRVGHSLLERKQVRKPGRDTPGCWPFPVPRCDESSFMIIIKLTLFLSRKLEELTDTCSVRRRGPGSKNGARGRLTSGQGFPVVINGLRVWGPCHALRMVTVSETTDGRSFWCQNQTAVLPGTSGKGPGTLSRAPEGAPTAGATRAGLLQAAAAFAQQRGGWVWRSRVGWGARRRWLRQVLLGPHAGAVRVRVPSVFQPILLVGGRAPGWPRLVEFGPGS